MKSSGLRLAQLAHVKRREGRECARATHNSEYRNSYSNDRMENLFKALTPFIERKGVKIYTVAHVI